MLTCAIHFADVDLNELVSKPGKDEKGLRHRGVALSCTANIETKGSIGKFFVNGAQLAGGAANRLSAIDVLDGKLSAESRPSGEIVDDIGMDHDRPLLGDAEKSLSATQVSSSGEKLLGLLPADSLEILTNVPRQLFILWPGHSIQQQSPIDVTARGALLSGQRTVHNDTGIGRRECVEGFGDLHALRAAVLASDPEMLPLRPGSALKRFERGHRFPSSGHGPVWTGLLILSSRRKVISTKRLSAFHCLACPFRWRQRSAQN